MHRDACFAGAFEQARLIRERELSAVELVSATLRQIDRLDPHLNAYRVVFAESALVEARQIDAAPSTGRFMPLLGVPVAIKDDCDVAGELTARGTNAFGEAPSADAEVVRRLRDAGAIVIGKTHVPPMDAWPWTSSEQWGITRNPWDLDRTPGGSSGGSAAAVAAGMCGVALGSDGGGSVRYPAALVGAFGLKPQRGRIPLDPQVGGWNGLLALGPLSRTVRDAALFLDATAGTSTLSHLARAREARRIAVSYEPPRGSFARLGHDARRAVASTADLLAGLGHHVFERQLDYGSVMRHSTIRYLDGVARDVQALTHPDRLDRTTRRLARLGTSLPASTVRRAVAAEAKLAAAINVVFDDADLVLTPMTGDRVPAAASGLGRGLLWSLLHSNVAAWAVPWNAIGQPAASVPAGFDASGLPLAVQLCGPVNGENVLLEIASQIEDARPWSPHRPELAVISAEIE